MINPEKPSGTKTQKNHPSHHYPLLTKIPLEEKLILKKKKPIGNLEKPATSATTQPQQCHTHTNTNHQQSHTHTNHQTSWSQQQPPHPPFKPPISKPKPSINKPTLPIWNPSHRKYPKIITGATIGATDDQPKWSTHRSTDPPFQTYRSTDPNPPSTDPSPTIQT